MNKSIFCLIAWLCFNPALQSQVGFLDSTYRWTEVQYYPLGYSSFTHTMSSTPTVMNGQTYYQVLSSSLPEGGQWHNETWLFLRYENQKLYAGYINDEIMVFDYSLDVMDTFYAEGAPSFVVLSVDSIELENGEYRKRLRTRCTDDSAWGDWPVDWIEGLGSTAGIVQYSSMCAFDSGSELLCIWKDGDRIYTNPDLDSCWLHPVHTKDLDVLNIQVNPNPVGTTIYISDPEMHVTEAEVYDLFGRCVSKTKETLTIAADQLHPGYYVLVLHLKDGQRVSSLFIKT